MWQQTALQQQRKCLQVGTHGCLSLHSLPPSFPFSAHRPLRTPSRSPAHRPNPSLVTMPPHHNRRVASGAATAASSAAAAAIASSVSTAATIRTCKCTRRVAHRSSLFSEGSKSHARAEGSAAARRCSTVRGDEGDNEGAHSMQLLACCCLCCCCLCCLCCCCCCCCCCLPFPSNGLCTSGAARTTCNGRGDH
jgi:hypothetical protein